MYTRPHFCSYPGLALTRSKWFLARPCKEPDNEADQWQEKHRRYFQLAGITVRVESDLDFDTIKFKDEFTAFAVDGSGDDNVTFRHYFELPDLKDKNLGEELYRKPPWSIFRKNGTWFYFGISPTRGIEDLHRVAVFNADHTRATIYSPPRDRDRILTDGWQSLSLFPTDQIWLGPLLADRDAVLLHSAAAIVNGQGLVFVGHSGAGKSTTMELLKVACRESGLDAEILCDDRNVVRKWPDGWRVHGTWSHGEIPDVSSASAKLKGIFFLNQANFNQIVPIENKNEITRKLLPCFIKPFVTANWWSRILELAEKIVREAHCFDLYFDKSGKIVDLIC